MADERVRDVQNWLNNTYGSNANWVQVDADGQTGFYTVKALVRALQIELGLEVDGTFGNGTKNGFNTKFPNGLSKSTDATEQSTKNIIAIVNGGFWCRGIEGEVNDKYVFGDYTEAGVILMKSQLGILQPTGEIKAREMKAILTTDAYTLTSNGDANVREIQQQINRKYINVFDSYIATNGIYERNMNTAIIKAIQHEIGVEVDGGWGEGTKSALPVLGPGSSRTNLVYILQYLLYLNGFNPNGFDGGFGNGVTTALKAFQTLMELDVDGYCGRQAWSALVVSCGDTARSANACDTCFEITAERAQLLKENGFQVVGRYINGFISNEKPKKLQVGELETIFNAGLGVFFIYQGDNTKISDFGYANGYEAGLRASKCARKYNILADTIIYFAVDLDVYEDQIETDIVPYFEGIQNSIDNYFKIGVYAPRKVCSVLAEKNLTVSSFVSDMSTGFSCNIGSKMPNNWDYDQFKEISNYNNELDIDKVTYRGRIPTTTSVGEGDYNYIKADNVEVIQILEEIYELAGTYIQTYHPTEPRQWEDTIKDRNILVLQFLRQIAYDDFAWDLVAGEIDDNWINFAKNALPINMAEEYLYISNNCRVGLIHLAVVLESNIFNHPLITTSLTNVITDLSGWAGDLISFASELNEEVAEADRDNFTVEQIMNKLGGKTGSTQKFDYEDLIQDVDAVNLWENLRTQRIDTVFSNYYNTNVSRFRFSTFYNKLVERGNLPSEVLSSNSVHDILYAIAYQYLSRNNTEIAGCVSDMFATILYDNYDIEDWASKVSEAFATKLTNLIDAENA